MEINIDISIIIIIIIPQVHINIILLHDMKFIFKETNAWESKLIFC